MTTPSWSPQQAEALDRVAAWFTHGTEAPFYLAGLAGTGKTTLAKYFAETLGVRVMFAAFTGKAASVLRSKGCPGATTIHSLIYKPSGSKQGARITELEELILEEERLGDDADKSKLHVWRTDLQELKKDDGAMFARRDDDDLEIRKAGLVIVDECSMIDRRMGTDLESFGVPILYLGDPGQLPPVSGKPHLTNNHDFLLTEIHRQAVDSPIIQLAHMVRRGGKPQWGSMGDGQVRILPKKDFDWNECVTAGKLLCGMNATLHRLNRGVRKAIGFTEVFPLAGDRLICRKNDRERGFLNGVEAEATSGARVKGNVAWIDLDYDGMPIKQLMVDPGRFEETYGQRTKHPRQDAVYHFDYGYAITGHRAQGSQWEKVVICDDKMRANDPDHRKKWLYTCITRAEKELLIYA